MAVEIKSREKYIPTLVVLLIIAAFFLGALTTKLSALQGGTGTQAQPTDQQAAQQPPEVKVTLDQIKAIFDNPNVIKIGDANKKLLMVEVSDPSCPYCGIASGKNPKLNTDQFKLVADGGTYVAPVEEMKKLSDSGQASFAYVYMPGHGNGEMGMKALYCANDQGKFWEVEGKIMSAEGYSLMNDTIKNDKAQSGKLAEFLADVIDSQAMKTCLDSGKYDKNLTETPKLAQGLGVQGTPGFFLNTTNFPGAFSWTDMKSAADAALK